MGYIEDLRKIIGHQPLILVGVAVAIVNENEEILLQKRWDGSWGMPGGLMELGESTEETGRREVLEETGLLVGEMELITVFSGKEYFQKLPNGDEFHPISIVYFSKEIKAGILRADGIESNEVQFFKKEKLPKKLHSVFKNLLSQHPALFCEK